MQVPVSICSQFLAPAFLLLLFADTGVRTPDRRIPGPPDDARDVVRGFHQLAARLAVYFDHLYP